MRKVVASTIIRYIIITRLPIILVVKFEPDLVTTNAAEITDIVVIVIIVALLIGKGHKVLATDKIHTGIRAIPMWIKPKITKEK